MKRSMDNNDDIAAKSSLNEGERSTGSEVVHVGTVLIDVEYSSFVGINSWGC